MSSPQFADTQKPCVLCVLHKFNYPENLTSNYKTCLTLKCLSALTIDCTSLTRLNFSAGQNIFFNNIIASRVKLARKIEICLTIIPLNKEFNYYFSFLYLTF